MPVVFIGAGASLAGASALSIVLKTHDLLLIDISREFNDLSPAQHFNDQFTARPQGAQLGVNLVEVLAVT
jgi:hypothetical protein